MNQNSVEIKFYIDHKQNYDEIIKNIKVLTNILTLTEKIVIDEEKDTVILKEIKKLNILEYYDTVKILSRLSDEIYSINSKEKGFLL